MLSVLVVHYHSRGLVEGLAEDLLAQQGQAFEVVLVECGADGSLERAEAILRRNATPVTTVRPGRNLGYCAGNNAAASAARAGTDLVIVNPDVRMPHHNSLARLAAHLEKKTDVAAVAPAIVDDEGVMEYASSTVNLARGEYLHADHRRRWSPDEPEEISLPWINGACMAVRRSVWEDVGGFDEQFFLFFDEVDWCMRATQAGWRVVLTTETSVRHQRSASFGTSTKGAYYYWRNRYLLNRKVQGRGRWTLHWARDLAKFAIRRRHLRSGASISALHGATDAMLGRVGPRPGRP